MSAFIDLTGLKFGKLTVLKRAKNNKKQTCWVCKCECGNEKIVQGSNLKSGNTTSCGCFCEHHDKRKTKLYGVWCTMRNRCYNKNVKSYKWYGSRGISVCDEWKNSFLSFDNWSMNNGYKDGLTLDRINVNGNYEPSNCRWVDMKTQQSNRRNNNIIEICGEKHTLMDWSRLTRISRITIYRRLKRGISGKALIVKTNAKKEV